MKVKTRKIVKKRFKLTGTGKLKHEVGGWGHLRLRKSGKKKDRKTQDRVITSKSQTRKIRAFLGK